MNTPLSDEFKKPGRQRVPYWFLRQAGRYLPEYLALRKEAPDFLKFCYSPELTVEAALQPIRRYDMDSAILFSDILVIPDAIGAHVRFVEGQGPVIDPIQSVDAVKALRSDEALDRLAPVFESISTLRAALPAEKSLIGFAGAPWTIALYMVEGRGGTGGETVCQWAYRDPAGFSTLIDLITESTTQYLIKQIDAGADVIQLFDSWAGLLSATEAERWSIEPTARIVKALKAHAPDVPVIGFPRLAGAWMERYVIGTGVDGVSLDPTVPLSVVRESLQSRCLVQGNLDPILLRVGGQPLDDAVRRIVEALAAGRFIFNLGHGIAPSTPPEAVSQVVNRLRQWNRESQSWDD
jgi:uroporphyrinogen decarboxylase